MIRLHLVGFTTDLKNLIFARRRGAKTGTFVVAIDSRLRKTLEEVARLEEQAKDGQPQMPKEAVARSKLSPKEIQNMLRRGKPSAEVARLAEADVSWVERFMPPIVGERSKIVDAVKVGSISKARLGKSAERVGDAIAANLKEKRVNLPPEVLDEGWDATLREGGWEVTFAYLSRGQPKEAKFSFDPETREVRAMNELARELAWRPNEQALQSAQPSPARRRPRTGSSSRRTPGKPARTRGRRGGRRR